MLWKNPKTKNFENNEKYKVWKKEKKIVMFCKKNTSY